jgi:hypothetical protein
MAITLTLPSGVTTARSQVHPVTVAIAGLTASTAFQLQDRLPAGTIGATGSLAPYTEITFNSDAAGNATLVLFPQVSGTHSIVVVPNPARFENTIAPAMGAAITNDASTFTATLTVGP